VAWGSRKINMSRLLKSLSGVVPGGGGGTTDAVIALSAAPSGSILPRSSQRIKHLESLLESATAAGRLSEAARLIHELDLLTLPSQTAAREAEYRNRPLRCISRQRASTEAVMFQVI